MSLTYEFQTGVTLELDKLRHEEITDAVAQTNLELIASTYAAQFERSSDHPNRPLAPGAVMAHFRPHDEAKIAANRARIERSMEDQGAAYWRGHVEDTLAVLVKETPSYGRRYFRYIGGGAANMYLNDILVTPERQQAGLGSAALHGVIGENLARQRYAERAGLVLDAYAGSPVNSWFRALGLQESGPSHQNNPMEIGGQILRQIRYETNGEQGLHHVWANLTRRVARYAGHTSP